MAIVTCGGVSVLSGLISLPLRGAWYADLVLDTAETVSGAVKLTAVGGLELSGTIIGSPGVALDTCYVRVVGGAGKLSTTVTKAFQRAKLRDPFDAILKAAGETKASSSSSTVLAVDLTQWTIAGNRASVALDDLAGAASRALGEPVNWRHLPDGSVWIGTEGWASAKLPVDAVLLASYPVERRHEFGVSTPALMPGVDLENIGKVSAVEHYIDPHRIRTRAWA